MKTRSLASIALGFAVVLGTAGCGAVTPQATTITFSPSDGVNVAVPSDAPVVILNALLVKGEDAPETDANFVATLVNKSDESQTVTLSWDGGSAAIDVDADSTAVYGPDETLLLQNIASPAGATEDIVFQSGSTAPVTEAVQVFDTELAHLSTLAPTAPAE